MKDILDKVREKHIQKNIISLCNKVEKKCSFKSGKDVENLLDLVFWLYIYGDSDLALELCLTTKEEVFNLNFNIWTFMHCIWGLEARIIRENGNAESSTKICSDIDRHWLIPNSVFNTPEKMQEFEMKRRARFTYDGVIEKEKIAFYESENNKKNANAYRMIALQKNDSFQ